MHLVHYYYSLYKHLLQLESFFFEFNVGIGSCFVGAFGMATLYLNCRFADTGIDHFRIADAC